jgi:hypothetical protein
MDEKKITNEISVEIAKSIDGVIGSVMMMDLKTFKKALRELNKVLKGEAPVKTLSIVSPSAIVFFSTFENDKVLIVKIDNFKGNPEDVRGKIENIVNKKNPVYQIAKALEDKEE